VGHLESLQYLWVQFLLHCTSFEQLSFCSTVLVLNAILEFFYSWPVVPQGTSNMHPFCLITQHCAVIRRLNNNTLSGAFPLSAANLSHLIFLWVLNYSLHCCVICVLCWLCGDHWSLLTGIFSGICPTII
jgi:hypothetical protein